MEITFVEPNSIFSHGVIFFYHDDSWGRYEHVTDLMYLYIKYDQRKYTFTQKWAPLCNDLLDNVYNGLLFNWENHICVRELPESWQNSQRKGWKSEILRDAYHSEFYRC